MNPFISAVNRKQFFARLLLDKCLPAEDPYGHASQALAESALYQLESAYRNHLKSIAHDYQCADPEAVTSVQRLSEALRAKGKHPAEAVEIGNLEQDSDSWLSDMLIAHSRLSRGESATGQASIEKLGIALQEVSDEAGTGGISQTLTRQWLAALTEMVERHREMMVEN